MKERRTEKVKGEGNPLAGKKTTGRWNNLVIVLIIDGTNMIAIFEACYERKNYKDAVR